MTRGNVQHTCDSNALDQKGSQCNTVDCGVLDVLIGSKYQCGMCCVHATYMCWLFWNCWSTCSFYVTECMSMTHYCIALYLKKNFSNLLSFLDCIAPALDLHWWLICTPDSSSLGHASYAAVLHLQSFKTCLDDTPELRLLVMLTCYSHERSLYVTSASARHVAHCCRLWCLSCSASHALTSWISQTIKICECTTS